LRLDKKTKYHSIYVIQKYKKIIVQSNEKGGKKFCFGEPDIFKRSSSHL
jgi:hypothetical protein